jgi:hypothetical protein
MLTFFPRNPTKMAWMSSSSCKLIKIMDNMRDIIILNDYKTRRFNGEIGLEILAQQ